MSEIQAIRERHRVDENWHGPWDETQQWQTHYDRATLLSALTAAEARAEAAEARVGELGKLCKEAADLYGQGGTFPIDGAMSERLRTAARTHAEALLNPDPWRPIEEATTDMPDDVKYVLAHKADPEWICLADGPPEDGKWYSDGWLVEPTHFRELKGPGQ